MLTPWLAAAAVLAVLTLAPGPDMAVVTRRVLIGGLIDARLVALGVTCGLLVWGALAVVGLTALLVASPTAYVAVKVLGVCYLVFLGVQALRGGGHEPAIGEHPRDSRPFLTGLVTNLLNPKIAVFYAALLPSLAPAGSGAVGLAVLVLLHACLSITWLWTYAAALHRGRAFFDRPAVRRWTERFAGVVLLGFALRLATDKP